MVPAGAVKYRCGRYDNSKDNAKIGKNRVFPISFLFARAFPGIRMRKLRGLGLPLGLWWDKLCRIGPIANPRPFCVLA